MPIQAYVTAIDPGKVTGIHVEEQEILSTLGPDEDAVAVQLQELFTAVTQSITDSLEVESKLTLEITGSISFKVQGGVKYLFFNVGGEAGSTGTMKVTLSTTLQPKNPQP